MYVRKEAVLSSQIEGTQSSLNDVLEAEAEIFDSQRPRDVDEVLNYVRAMNHGLERLHTLPLSVRLIREIHVCFFLAYGVVNASSASCGRFRTGLERAVAQFSKPPSCRHRRRSCLKHLAIFDAFYTKKICPHSSKSGWLMPSSKPFILFLTATAAWDGC